MSKFHYTFNLAALFGIILSCITHALSPSSAYTSAVLRVVYDGTLFHGWSDANDGSIAILPNDGEARLNKRSRSRRNRLRPSVKMGEVRSVQGTLRFALSKLYGNVDVHNVIIEGCSRTDAGVSARHMIALIYCLKEVDKENKNVATLSIKGKRIPHPSSPRDEEFKPLPFDSDLQKMVYALNKMLPPDVMIADASTMPTDSSDETHERPFHPSLDTISKTYSYTFSVGIAHDPLQCRNDWHIQSNNSFNMQRAQDCASRLCGTHDFINFRGAFRGSERGKIQDTTCTIHNISICEEGIDTPIPSYSRYKISVEGNRFLYKMVRFLVGIIVQYGTDEKKSWQDLSTALSSDKFEEYSKDTDERNDQPKAKARLCAPANGLILDDVTFDNRWRFHWTLQ